ncbi:bromodomain adjacent to zinc finger domain protein 1A-like [Tachypleus tridentatus]|uniref:bromodomain adjacent to zinc finger domain protein 1A-like n=1 Tax=Tachypleus tridentatus TaxID=6853 RepID=UPI003FD6679E
MKDLDISNRPLTSVYNSSKKEGVPLVQLEQLNMTCFDKQYEKEEKNDKVCTSKKRDLKNNGNILIQLKPLKTTFPDNKEKKEKNQNSFSLNKSIQKPNYDPFVQLEAMKMASLYGKKKDNKREKDTKSKIRKLKQKKAAQNKKSTQGKLPFKKVEVQQSIAFPSDSFTVEELRKKMEEKRLKRQKETAQKIEEAKQKKKEERAKEKAQRQEEKRVLAELFHKWKKPRDDLMCDDNKDLPVPTPLDCCIPQESFGDAVMVLEFLNSFGDLLEMKDFFPQGFTLEHLDKTLQDTDIEGPLNNLVQMLLTTIFRFQEEEEEINKHIVDSSTVETGDGQEENLSCAKAVNCATIVSTWPQLFHGTSLKQISLDAFTVTEVLRLHLLSSGAQSKARRNYSPKEDPGLWFHIQEGSILRKLSHFSIFELTVGEKVKILKVLVDQLLTFDAMRDVIEENTIKLKKAKTDLKHLQWDFNRKEKEMATIRHKKEKVEKNKKKKGLDSFTENTVVDKNIVKEGKEEEGGEKQEPGNNLPQEEWEEQKKEKVKENVHCQEEFHKKEKELISLIHQLHRKSHIVPLGQDRAYRRFWCFSTVPGLFVEDNDSYVGTCLAQPTQYDPNSIPIVSKNELSAPLLKKLFQQTSGNNVISSDKECEIDKTSQTQTVCSLMKTSTLSEEFNARGGVLEKKPINCKVSLSTRENESLKKSPTEAVTSNSSSIVTSPVFGVCTACPDTCPVHNLTLPRTTWSFYTKPEDLDELISNLNPRGFRERLLQETLRVDRKYLVEQIDKCPCHKLNKNILPPAQPEVRKSQRLQYNKPSQYAEMSPGDALELTLRDMLLEMEDKLNAGNLGDIKVKDKEVWRQAIENRSYDMQCDGPHWGYKNNRLLEDNMSKPSTSLTQAPVSSVVKDLSCALLQIAQSVEPRYLQSPLGEDEEFKWQKQKALSEISQWKAKQEKNGEIGENEDDEIKLPVKVPLSPLERWIESLMASSSISQLFVHLSTLEKSIAWSRSVLKAYCHICCRRGNPELMLLCDGCDRGHHIYCLKPPLKQIPVGDWFCQNCKPKEIISFRQKPRVNYCEDEEESELDCDKSSMASDERDCSENSNDDVCKVCHKDGTLICCGICPLVYHLECVNPPLKRVPRGAWSCPRCVNRECQKSKNKKGSYQTRASVPVMKENSRETRNHSKQNSEEGKPNITKRKSKTVISDGCNIHHPFSSQRRSERKPKLISRKRKSEDSEDGYSIYGSRNSITSSEDGLLKFRTCDSIISELIRHPESWPFLRPVSRNKVSDYYTIIRSPMDFRTIKTKLDDLKYLTNKEFIADVNLVFQNCERYNERDSETYKAGVALSKLFDSLLKQYCLENYRGISTVEQFRYKTIKD